MTPRGGSIDPRKAALVGDFLKDEFAGHSIYDAEGFDRDCQFYRIDESTGRVRHRVRVSREFLDDHSEDQILQKLRAWDVSNVIRRAGARSVLITNTGCLIETEEDRREPVTEDQRNLVARLASPTDEDLHRLNVGDVRHNLQARNVQRCLACQLSSGNCQF